MKCPNCGVENLEGIRFCNYCGKEFPRAAPAVEPPKMAKCPNCGFNNPDGAIFCNQCGKDMRPVVTGPTVASPLPNTRPCVSCGRMIPSDASLCPYCRYSYRAPPAPVAPPMPPPPYAAPQQVPGATKNCFSCGRVVPADANMCPYCRTNFKAVAPAPQPAQYPPQPATMYPSVQSQQSSGMRPCVFCGKSIPTDANMCPYCMYKYRK